MDLIAQYWWLILAAVAVLILLFMLLGRRQRVNLSDDTPVRPHMAYGKKDAPPAERRGLVGEAAAAAGDVTGDILRAPVHAKLGSGADDLAQLKGVGPKFADTLAALGFTRFEQIAGLSPTEVERLDPQLGAFRGRIARDRIVEQAEYLARHDIDGFEQRFGKL